MKKSMFRLIFIIFIFILLLNFLLNESVENVSNVFNLDNVYIYKPKIKIIDINSKSRPYAVSINNNHSSWPHVGLQEAYLCYELIAEGGITRILAFYKDKNLDKIGSVRSARHYFLDYVLENDAIFVHYGHSPKALEDINSLSIDNINGMNNSKAFFRDKTLNKAYEHTAFTSTSLINEYISKFKYRNTTKVNLLDYNYYDIDFSSDSSVINAREVIINYSKYTNTKYVYDEVNKNYVQYMSDIIQKDGISGKNYTVKNIITYKVENKLLDNKGRQDLYNIGSGKGYYISNGKAISITWKKDSRSSQTIYYNSNGEKIKVNDGNTWIHIQPIKESLIIK